MCNFSNLSLFKFILVRTRGRDNTVVDMTVDRAATTHARDEDAHVSGLRAGHHPPTGSH